VQRYSTNDVIAGDNIISFTPMKNIKKLSDRQLTKYNSR
jgi:hypothetical protein